MFAGYTFNIWAFCFLSFFFYDPQKNTSKFQYHTTSWKSEKTNPQKEKPVFYGRNSKFLENTMKIQITGPFSSAILAIVRQPGLTFDFRFLCIDVFFLFFSEMAELKDQMSLGGAKVDSA